MPKTGRNIRKRTDGRWEGRYKYFTSEKSFKMRSVYGKTCGEVKEKIGLLIAEQNKEMQQMEVKREIDYQTFGKVTEEWLFVVKETKKYSTYVKYRGICEKHLKLLGDIYIEEISNALLNQKIFQNPESTDAAFRYSQNLKRTITQLVNQIIRFGNDAYNYQIPTLANHAGVEKGKIFRVINHAEQAALFRYLSTDTDCFKAGISICYATGLRLGEICSLKWTDIDFVQRIIHVNRTIQRIAVIEEDAKTTLMETTPKSDFSMREIPVSDFVFNILSGLDHAGEYVIGGQKPVEPRTYENCFKRYAGNAGIGIFNFHVLRHTFATNCIENGMDVKTLSEILGHSNVQITLNRYVHPTIESKRRQMKKMDEYYSGVVE